MNSCDWCGKPASTRSPTGRGYRCKGCLNEPCCVLCGDADTRMDNSGGRWICGGCADLGGTNVPSWRAAPLPSIDYLAALGDPMDMNATSEYP